MKSLTPLSDARPALILAPGMLSDEAVWAPQAEAFAADFDVRVARYGEARTLAGMAQSLLQQGPPRFALAAHSLGGRVAMEAARLQPERIAGLCLISSDPLPKPAGEAGEAETRGRHGLLALARGQGMTALADRFTPVVLHPDSLARPDLKAQVHAMVARQDVQALARQIEAGEGRPDHAEVLRGLKVPALLICGAEDSFGRAPLQAALLPGAPLLMIDHCGHLPMLEAPDAVTQAMRGWLSGIASEAFEAGPPSAKSELQGETP